MTYLGTVLSYEGYEEQTLHHRLGIAELQRYRLHKPLQGRHDLSLGGRTRCGVLAYGRPRAMG